MSMQTTRKISRDDAIQRIIYISSLILNNDYRRIESKSSEPDNDVEYLVNNAVSFSDTDELLRWTNGMLEAKIDTPFFRHSYLDNYDVI